MLRILYFTRSLNVVECRQIAFPTQVTAAWSQCRPMCTHHPSQIHRIPKLDISAQVSLGVLLHMYMTCTRTPHLVAVCNDTLLVSLVDSSEVQIPCHQKYIYRYLIS